MQTTTAAIFRTPTITRGRRSLSVRAYNNNNSDDKHEAQDRLKHIRKILLAERKRLEDRRKESFDAVSAALHKMAQDELNLIKSVVLRTDGHGGDNDAAGGAVDTDNRVDADN